MSENGVFFSVYCENAAFHFSGCSRSLNDFDKFSKVFHGSRKFAEKALKIRNPIATVGRESSTFICRDPPFGPPPKKGVLHYNFPIVTILRFFEAIIEGLGTLNYRGFRK